MRRARSKMQRPCREALFAPPPSSGPSASFGSSGRVLYKAEASAYLSRRTLLLRAVAYRECRRSLSGGPPPGAAASAPSICSAAQREPRGGGITYLVPEAEAWNSAGSRMAGFETYDVRVLDDGFSWQGNELTARLSALGGKESPAQAVVGTALSSD